MYCRLRLNGKKPPAAAAAFYTHGAKNGKKTIAIQMNVDWVAPAPWAYSRKVKVRTDVWIWRVMSGSGVPIGMEKIIIKKVLIEIPRVPKAARTGYCVAAVGSTSAGLSGLLTAAGRCLPTATTSPAFALPEVKKSRVREV